MKNINFKRNIILSIIAVLFYAAPLKGQFADVGAGARASGMADAFTAEASGPETIYYNPAGAAHTKTYQFSSSYSRLFWGLSDKSNLGRGYLGYIMPVNEKIGAGFAWQHFMLDDYYSENSFYFSGAYKVDSNLSLGLNLKILSKKYASTPYTENSIDLNTGNVSSEVNPVFKNGYSKLGFTPDVGVLYKFNENHRAGLMLSNIIVPDLSLSSDDTDRLPLTLKAGYRFMASDMKILADIGYFSGDLNFYTGTEKWFNNTFAVRGGLGIGSRLYRNAAIGASYRINNTLKIDYAFNYPLSGIRTSYGTHKLGFVVRIGDISFKELKGSDKDKEQKIVSDRESRSVSGLITDGEKFMEENEYEKAREKFKDALRLEPENVKAQALLEEAEKSIEELSDKIKSSKKEYLEGVYHLNRDEYLAASEIFERLSSMETSGSKELEDLKARATDKYDQLKKEKLDKVQNLISRADEYLNDGRYDDALNYYKQALDIIPGNSKAEAGVREVNKKRIERYYESGVDAYLDENYSLAREQFKKVLQIDKNHKQSLDMLNIIEEEK